MFRERLFMFMFARVNMGKYVSYDFQSKQYLFVFCGFLD